MTPPSDVDYAPPAAVFPLEELATRDPTELTSRLQDWLSARLGVVDVRVSDLRTPKAGYSNETVLATASWRDAEGDAGRDATSVAGGEAQTRRFVLRIQPSGHQVFVEPDALRQARVIARLHGRVPVPALWLTEADPAVLGAPFYLMEMIDGRVPSDVPSWHKRGWTTELTPAERATLYDNALTAMVALHALERTRDLAFLEPAGTGSHLDRYLADLQRWHAWCQPVLRYDTDVIDAALSRVLSYRPAVTRTGVVWGDARVGNVVFGPDQSVAAMLDWESATVGPPEIDVGWWLMFECFLCEAQGLTRLEGVAGREATVERYEQVSGHRLVDIRYFEILAGVVFSLVNSRIADLLTRAGTLPAPVAAEYVTRVTTMLAGWLDD